MTAPFLHALSCSKCGAALSPTPGQQILTCPYCAQAHVFEPPRAPERLAPRATPVRARSLVVAVFVGLLVLGGALFVTLRARREPPVVAATGVAPVVDADGPGDPSAGYQVGQAVDIHWGSTWYAGRVLRVNGQHYEVSYDGWSAQWNEWVLASRLRARAGGSAAKPTASAAEATYTAGEAVQIEWHGSWFPGRVLEVDNARYKITYDGYASSWDEWVEAPRLRRP